MKKTIRFGSRKSALAVAQTRLIMDAVQSSFPDVSVELVTMETTGDVNMKPFSEASDKFGIKGLFTQELEEALRDGSIDVAVHSLKDMPMYSAPGLPIVAFSKRGDARDVLVLPHGGAVSGAPVGCSSARRRLQLKKIFPEATVEPVRGNVNTRLRKLDGGGFSALVLAAAGLLRIGLGGRISKYFSVDEIIPAPGQGILACQGRCGEDYWYLSAVNDRCGELCALAERTFSAELGGGCASPVGAFADIIDGRMTLRGFYADEEAGVYRKGSVSGDAAEAAVLARALARRLKEGE